MVAKFFYWQFTKWLNLSFESLFSLVNNVSNFVFVFDIEVNVMKLASGKLLGEDIVEIWTYENNLK